MRTGHKLLFCYCLVIYAPTVFYVTELVSLQAFFYQTSMTKDFATGGLM